MNFALLATQIRIPPQASQIIARRRLTDILETGLPSAKLILVAAPAGYGKTTLLSQWASASKFTIAWISLTEAENDSERFFRYVYRAWEQVQPGIRESVFGTLFEGPTPEIQAILPAFINLANETSESITFVLDDYHLIENTAIHQAIAFLLDHLPSNSHLIISTRTNPPLPIARYRARSQLLEIRMEALQFRLEETDLLYNQFLDLHLPGDELQSLQTQVEGWPAGLRLAGLTLSHHQPKSSEPLISGKHRFIADYLTEEVLNGQPAARQRFLLQTSILDRLSHSLCDAITGQQDGQSMLETLEHENLFLVALDDSREWYRYHHLFGDFLRQELARRFPDQAPDLHRKAAQWFLDREMPEQAYQHALAAGDLHQMAEIFNRYANAKLYAGEFNDLKRWLEGLPAEWFIAYPALGLARAGYLAYTGSFDACLRVINEVEQALTPPHDTEERHQLARVKAVRCFIACRANNMPQAEALASQALQELPKEDVGYLPNVYSALGDTYRKNGLWEKALQCYQQALAFPHAPAIQVLAASIYGAIADLNLHQGRLHSAASYWEKALDSIQSQENWGRVPLPLTGWIYIRSAELLYEWNMLETAADHLAHGLARAELGGDVRSRIAGKILSARLSLARGHVEEAEAAIHEAQQLLEQVHFPEWTAHVEHCQVGVWIAGDQLQVGMAWCNAALENETLEDRQESGLVRLAAARVLIARGDRSAIDRALAVLDAVLKEAESSGRSRTAIESLALLALAKWQSGDRPAALTFLERALRKAEPEGYQRLFVDLGLPMGRLLQEAGSRSVMSSYIETLLTAFDNHFSTPSLSHPSLPEPLTAREQEILQALAAGLSNREIAEQMLISPETVKKHVANIIDKLGASNRTEAAARARELGLLHR